MNPIFKRIYQLLTEAKKGKKLNPWAVCTTSVGRDDADKYERCVMKVKKKHGIKESSLLVERGSGVKKRQLELGIGRKKHSDSIFTSEDPVTKARSKRAIDTGNSGLEKSVQRAGKGPDTRTPEEKRNLPYALMKSVGKATEKRQIRHSQTNKSMSKFGKRIPKWRKT